MSKTAGMTLASFSIDRLRRDMNWGYIATWQHLVEACMKKHRSIDFGAVTVGGKLFAGWLVRERDRFVDANEHRAVEPDWSNDSLLCDAPLVERLLAAMVDPDDAVAEKIARLTEGAVLPDMWARLAMDEGAAGACAAPVTAGDIHRRLKPIDWGQVSVKETPKPQPVEIAPGIDARHTHGTLGRDVPSGPLFHTVIDKRHDGHFVVTGMGMAFRLDLAAAQSLRSGLDEAIAHVLDQRKAA